MTSISRSIPELHPQDGSGSASGDQHGLRAGTPLTPAAKEIEDIAKSGEISMESSVTLRPGSGIGTFRGIGEGLVTHVVILCLLLIVGKDTVTLR